MSASATTGVIRVQETTPLLQPSPARRGRYCVMFTCAVAAVVIVIWSTFSGNVVRIEPQSSWEPYVQPPSDIYDLPLNVSCHTRYLDHTSNNLCRTMPDLCQKEFNCPRLAMPQFYQGATLAGFQSLYGGTVDYIPASQVRICQGEVFKNKVEYVMSREEHPVAGEIASCGEEGRLYPLSADKCAGDGNHGATGCNFLSKNIRVVTFNMSFFDLVYKIKDYIRGCQNRTISQDICHKS